MGTVYAYVQNGQHSSNDEQNQATQTEFPADRAKKLGVSDTVESVATTNSQTQQSKETQPQRPDRPRPTSRETRRQENVSKPSQATSVTPGRGGSAPSASPTAPAPSLVPTKSPTNLVATNVGMKSITISFTPGTDSDGVDYHQVLRDGYVIGTTTSNYFVNDFDVYPDEMFDYTVRVVDKLGNINPASAPLTVASKLDTEPPTTPTNLRVVSQEPGKTYIAWDASIDNSAVAGIDLDYGISINSGQQFQWVGDTQAVIYTKPGVTYIVSVQASDFSSNFSDAAGPLKFVGK